MFCPRCSQEQVSADIRFCSRCGLPLSDIAEAVDGGGYLDRNAGTDACAIRRSVFTGLFLMAASFIFLIVSLILGTPEPSFVVQWNLFLALAFFFGGLGLAGFTLYRNTAKARSRKAAADNSRSAVDIGPATTRALPDIYEAPAVVHTTRELDNVPSVVEQTTHTLRR